MSTIRTLTINFDSIIIDVIFGDNFMIYRVFCCFDQGRLVVLFNGFQKKTRKTPKEEIDRAMRLKDEYFNLKRQKNDNV